MQRTDFTFAHLLRVRFAEVDYQGVVFNAHYLTYLDTALTEYMRYLGMDVSLNANSKEFDFQLIKTTLEYKIPAKFDEEIEVAIRVKRIGNSSITFEAGVFNKANSALLVVGELVWVYTNLQLQKSVSIPATVRSFFEKDLV